MNSIELYETIFTDPHMRNWIEKCAVAGMVPSMYSFTVLCQLYSRFYKKLRRPEDMGARLGSLMPTGWIPGILCFLGGVITSPLHYAFVHISRYKTALTCVEIEWLQSRGLSLISSPKIEIKPLVIQILQEYEASSYPSTRSNSSHHLFQILSGIRPEPTWRYPEIIDDIEKQKHLLEYMSATKNQGKKLFKIILISLLVSDTSIIDTLLKCDIPLNVVHLITDYVGDNSFRLNAVIADKIDFR